MKQEYLNRIIDKEVEMALKYSGAILIEGPKWCGKTRTAEKHAASTLYLEDIEKEDYYMHILDTKPADLLKGETPRLIDEWQKAPKLWNGVRFAVDQRGGPGHFILTGSTLPKKKDEEKLHTGTGRIARILMRPMTLFESLESNGSVSLRSLFNGGDVSGVSSLSIEDIAFALARGGWPASIGSEKELALRHARDYVSSVVNSDISKVDDVERDPVRAGKLMRSIARNVSTMADMKTIRADIAENGTEEFASDKTAASYVKALERIFVIEDLPAWSPDMRSKTALRTSPKRHFVDPSIAAVALRVSPEGLLKDFKTFGLLFESLCIRDLRVYAQANEGEVYHFCDVSGLEADAIVHLFDGRWGAIEIKMGSREIDKAAENLIKLKNKVDLDEMREPSFLAVITATEHAYRRKDGVYVIPLGCLKD